MQIRLLTSIASAEWGGGNGAIVDIDADEAKRLIEAGYAEPAEGKRTATSEKRETAAAKKTKRS